MEQPSRKTVQRVRHELRMREVSVARIETVGEHFASITFQGEALADFVSLSFDDHVKFMFDDGAGNQVRRDYTPRRFNAQSRELTIEFALHGDGAASDWARHAQPGDRAIIGGPRGSMIIPPDVDWHLLAGDSTALPAMRRRLEELPAQVRATVVVLAGEGDRLPFTSAAQVDVHWVDSEDACSNACAHARCQRAKASPGVQAKRPPCAACAPCWPKKRASPRKRCASRPTGSRASPITTRTSSKRCSRRSAPLSPCGRAAPGASACAPRPSGSGARRLRLPAPASARPAACDARPPPPS